MTIGKVGTFVYKAVVVITVISLHLLLLINSFALSSKTIFIRFTAGIEEGYA